MALSDMKVFNEYVKAATIETLAQDVAKFNAASAGAIQLTTQGIDGDFLQESFWSGLHSAQRRVDRYGTNSAASATNLAQKQYDSVKIAGGFGPVLFEPSQLSWIQKSPQEALEVISRNLSEAIIADQLGAGVVALATPIIMKYEGLVQRTYRDPVGILTACYGHTGPELKMGQTFTRDQCEAMLHEDMAKHAKALECIKHPLKDHEAAAFLSFAFNVGNAAFCGSTLVRKANAGDMAGACAELSRWVYSGGRYFQGLANRRAAERAVCEGRANA